MSNMVDKQRVTNTYSFQFNEILPGNRKKYSHLTDHQNKGRVFCCLNFYNSEIFIHKLNKYFDTSMAQIQ